MPDEKEVLRYQLDITDAEAKAAKLQQLLEEIKAKKAAGQDVSELEAQFHREADGLGKVTQEQKKAGVATEELTRQKDKLANVVTLLGGRFGGTVSALGNVVELLMQGGRAAAGFAGALVGVTALAAAYQYLSTSIEEAIRKAEELNTKRLEGAEAHYQRVREIEAAFEKFGGATPERMQQAMMLGADLRRGYGYEAPAEALAAATAGGVGLPMEAGVLGLAMGRYGARVERPGDVATVLEELRKTGQFAELQAQLLNIATTETGKLVQLIGDIEDPSRQQRGGFIAERMYRAYRQAGKLPPGVETYGEFISVLQSREMDEEFERAGAVGRATVVPTTGGAGVAQTVININEQINAGHVQMGPDKRNSRHMVRMGVSKQDHRKPP